MLSGFFFPTLGEKIDEEKWGIDVLILKKYENFSLKFRQFLKEIMFIKTKKFLGTSMTQSVKHLILDFCSHHNFRIVRSGWAWSLLEVLSHPLPLPLSTHSHTLSLKNNNNNNNYKRKLKSFVFKWFDLIG